MGCCVLKAQSPGCSLLLSVSVPQRELCVLFLSLVLFHRCQVSDSFRRASPCPHPPQAVPVQTRSLITKAYAAARCAQILSSSSFSLSDYRRPHHLPIISPNISTASYEFQNLQEWRGSVVMWPPVKTSKVWPKSSCDICQIGTITCMAPVVAVQYMY